MTSLHLNLPYPPSVNTYWGFHGHRRFLTNKANDFKSRVAHAVSLTDIRFGNARLQITVALHAPDKRVRDIDNVVKPLLDALVDARLFDDDSQVDLITIMRKQPIKGGTSEVSIRTM
jgi:crossover junction endodeoxyribonuclease RusA